MKKKKFSGPPTEIETGQYGPNHIHFLLERIMREQKRQPNPLFHNELIDYEKHREHKNFYTVTHVTVAEMNKNRPMLAGELAKLIRFDFKFRTLNLEAALKYCLSHCPPDTDVLIPIRTNLHGANSEIDLVVLRIAPGILDTLHIRESASLPIDTEFVLSQISASDSQKARLQELFKPLPKRKKSLDQEVL